MTREQELCDHVFRFLRSVEMGHDEIGAWRYSHTDDVFYCERCLHTETRSFQPLYARSIRSHNTEAKPLGGD